LYYKDKQLDRCAVRL